MRSKIARFKYIAGLFLCLGALPRISRADTIYSNFGPGQTYWAFEGWVVSGSSSPNGSAEVAAAFTPSNNYDLTQIDVAIQNLNGTNGVVLSLVNDSGGEPTGTTIESWTKTGLPAFESTNSIVQTVVPVSILPLVAGDTYWIVASPVASDTFDAWNIDSLNGPEGEIALNSGSGWISKTSVDPAFDVLGTPTATTVPEPSTLLLLGTGLGAVCLRKRIRKDGRSLG